MSVKSEKIVIGAVYLQPHATAEIAEEFWSGVKPLIESQDEEVTNCMIFGDFNLPGVKWVVDDENDQIFYPTNVNTEKAKILMDGTFSCGLAQICNLKPTGRNQLDLIFTNLIDDFTVCEAAHCLKPASYHHKPIQLNLIIADSKSPEPLVEVYDLLKMNRPEIETKLNSTDWNQFFAQNDVNANADKFQTFLIELLDEHVPKKRLKNFSCPWHTPTLANARNRRNRAHKAYVELPSQERYNHFLNLREQYWVENETAYADYVKNYAEKLKDNPRSFWRFVNDKRQTNGIPSQMNLNGKNGTSQQENVELLQVSLRNFL